MLNILGSSKNMSRGGELSDPAWVKVTLHLPDASLSSIPTISIRKRVARFDQSLGIATYDQQGTSADGKPRVMILGCRQSSNLISTSTSQRKY